jgi:hypothetical protein
MALHLQGKTQKGKNCGIGTHKITQKWKHMKLTPQNHPKVEKLSKMVAKLTQNHSKIDPKSLKINAITENAQNHSRSSLLMRERLEPIKNGAKSQAKRAQKHNR